ncbi:MUTL protein, putative isoform 1 [Hibiscus syriacus]|uniref:MUTL protein, putative isoform 1 n=1 Tax=Hibiscus syriacus TaxID=106335 RepID=A0A6A2ZV57_HIBSY|nr:MUTL protein, putative isoform 1 [Hibiscus syriacus]
MEANICDINHLDADVLLPPRKRLLAGFKKQASNANATSDRPITSSSTSSPSPPSPSSATSSSDRRFSRPREQQLLPPLRLLKLPELRQRRRLQLQLAIAAAKSALDIATFSDDAVSKDRYLKKNKIKKHVPVQVLYNKHQPIENSRVDEDLAQRPKSLPTLESTKVPNRGIVSSGSPSSKFYGSTIAAKIDSDDLVREHVKVANDGKSGQSVLDNGEAESGYSMEKACEDAYPSSNKRGTVKLKNLPFSVCSYRDRVNHKEEMITKSSPLMEKKMGTPLWKCQDFKAPACIEQSEVMQS